MSERRGDRPAAPAAGSHGRVWTIGHGTRSTDELAALLRAAAIDTLVDVRRYPTGKRQPRFSRERLGDALPERGINYEWWGEALGGRREAAAGAEERTGWRNAAFAAYAEYAADPEFRAALAALEERAQRGERLALMCAETVWWRCHRRLIADALVADGFAVEHLMDRSPGGAHRGGTSSR
jgi:uncharacterized protein (DUF488 family)